MDRNMWEMEGMGWEGVKEVRCKRAVKEWREGFAHPLLISFHNL